MKLIGKLAAERAVLPEGNQRMRWFISIGRGIDPSPRVERAFGIGEVFIACRGRKSFNTHIRHMGRAPTGKIVPIHLCEKCTNIG